METRGLHRSAIRRMTPLIIRHDGCGARVSTVKMGRLGRGLRGNFYLLDDFGENPRSRVWRQMGVNGPEVSVNHKT
jgi:hypothetical protein